MTDTQALLEATGLNALVSEKDNEIVALRMAIELRDDEIQALKSEKQTVEKKFEDEKKIVDLLKHENTSNFIEMEQLKKEQNQLALKCDDLKQHSTSERAYLLKERDSLKSLSETYESKLIVKQRELDNMSEHSRLSYSQIHDEVCKLRNEKDLLAKEIESWKQKYATLQGDAHLTAQMNGGLISNMAADLKQKTEELKQANGDLAKSMEQEVLSRNLASNLQTIVKEKTTELEQVNKKREEAQEYAKEFKDDLSGVKKELEALKQKCTDYAMKLAENDEKKKLSEVKVHVTSNGVKAAAKKEETKKKADVKKTYTDDEKSSDDDESSEYEYVTDDEEEEEKKPTVKPEAKKVEPTVEAKKVEPTVEAKKVDPTVEAKKVEKKEEAKKVESVKKVQPAVEKKEAKKEEAKKSEPPVEAKKEEAKKSEPPVEEAKKSAPSVELDYYLECDVSRKNFNDDKISCKSEEELDDFRKVFEKAEQIVRPRKETTPIFTIGQPKKVYFSKADK